MLVFAAAAIGAAYLTSGSGVSRQNPRPQCLGYDTCPDYPLPYAFGQLPKTYQIEGKFPSDFIFGVGTSSYQIEGAYREEGRGASVWDTFTGANTVGMPGADCSYCCKVPPCPINEGMKLKGETGNVACDHYSKYKEDIALMKSMGLRHYRFSIAWPRIFPTGFSQDGVNEKGIAFYNDLIDALLAAGITPYVTLYHWDLPQGLLNPPFWQGWWSRDNATGKPNGQITYEFVAYADVCFSRFGDRVKTWTTFNEPWTATFLASGWGKAPSIPDFNNMSTDPWIGGHNMLNAHAAVVDLYRSKYQPHQRGKIGIVNTCDWREPRSDAEQDVAAADRGLLFNLGWYADPVYFGDYPEAMKRLYGDRLPEFTQEEKERLRGSTDFFGLNFYTAGWYEEVSEAGADTSYSRITLDGLPRAQSEWLYSAPWGLRKMLSWIKKRYKSPPIYLMEGGWSLAADTANQGVADRQRTMYFANHTAEVFRALREDGVDVRSYFAWSLMDNFEWNMGYKERFGIVFNDFMRGLDTNAPTNRTMQPTAGKQIRRRKESSCWLESVWRNNELIDPSSAAFTGCSNCSEFSGTFVDTQKSHSKYILSMQTTASGNGIFETSGTIRVTLPPFDLPGAQMAADCSGSTIVADFTLVLGSGFMSGYWNAANKSIHWGDGSTWVRVS